MTTSRELLETVLACEKGERIPYCPAIYEHKAYLIGKTPSQVCRDPELLLAALLKEYEVYRPDFMTVGIDVYNVEAEALGCKVIYFDDSADVPGVAEPLISTPGELANLTVPDPETAGRMPLYLEAAERLLELIGDQVIVRGAISGPLSMASELVGAENFIVMTLQEPEFVRRLMKFTAEVGVAFGKAFIARGIEPVIFDSRAMPPLCSPAVFKDLVAPTYAKHVTPQLKSAGARHIPLVIGGDTTPILEDLIATGATQLLCDFEGDRSAFMAAGQTHNIPFRVNVDPRLLHLGPVEEIQTFTMDILSQCWDHPGFILGTGVAAYDCPPEHIKAVRACFDMDYKSHVPEGGVRAAAAEAEALKSETRPAYDTGLDPILFDMAEAIEEGDDEDVPILVDEALSAEIDPEAIVNDAMIPAMNVIGDRFARGELFVPEMLISARAMKAGMEIVRPVLVKGGVKPIGEVLLGTVKGDIHDIGKNLSGMMLEGAGFNVTDIGVNVAAETFVQTLRETGIRIVGMSALLTTTMGYMGQVIEALEEAGMRDEVQVLIGGATISEEFRERIGADFYGETAADAVDCARRALDRLKSRRYNSEADRHLAEMPALG